MFYKKWKQGCKDKIFVRLAFSLEDSCGQAGCKSICIAPGFFDIWPGGHIYGCASA